MKVAVLSDIHGNAAALREVLDEASKFGIQFLFILGDLVGYYYRINEVMNLLEKWPKEIVRGNHEEMLRNVMEKSDDYQKNYSRYGSAINIALNTLTSSQINSLITLPFHMVVKLDRLNCLLCHGSPWDINDYIYPDSPVELIEKCIIPGIDYVFLGHTHYQFIYYNETSIIVNPGSVGQAREYGGVADWVVFDSINRTIDFKHTSYYAGDLISEVKVIDPHCPYLWEVLQRKPSTKMKR